jgi:site-specific recombinase XerD
VWALEARGLGSVSINVRITAVRKLAVEAANNGLLAPELAAGISRVKGAKSKGVRVGNWLSLRQAQALLNAPDATTKKGLRDRAMLAILFGCGLRRSEVAALTLMHIQQRDNRWCIVDVVGKHGRHAHDSGADLGKGGDRHLDRGSRLHGGGRVPSGEPR